MVIRPPGRSRIGAGADRVRANAAPRDGVGREQENGTVAIAAYFHPKGMTLAQFEEIHRRLDKAGEGENKDRLHHSCMGDDGDLMVYDIWATPEAFEAFGKVLMPILAEVGVDPGEPAVMPVHKLIQVSENS